MPDPRLPLLTFHTTTFADVYYPDSPFTPLVGDHPLFCRSTLDDSRCLRLLPPHTHALRPAPRRCLLPTRPPPARDVQPPPFTGCYSYPDSVPIPLPTTRCPDPTTWMRLLATPPPLCYPADVVRFRSLLTFDLRWVAVTLLLTTFIGHYYPTFRYVDCYVATLVFFVLGVYCC